MSGSRICPADRWGLPGDRRGIYLNYIAASADARRSTRGCVGQGMRRTLLLLLLLLLLSLDLMTLLLWELALLLTLLLLLTWLLRLQWLLRRRVLRGCRGVVCEA